MKVRGLDGYKYDWKFNGEEVNIDKRSRSGLHLEARSLLKTKFPTQMLLEEVPIEVRRGKTLFLDFYIPMRQLAIEVHGQQHYSYSTLFHRNQQDFMQQQKNDRDKAEWCEINGIDLIILPYNELETWGQTV